MTADDLRWMIGIALSAVLAIGGMLVAAYQKMTTRIDGKTDALHERVNKIREDFVRRDDMDKHMIRFDGNVNELRREIRASHEDTNRRLDALLERLPPRS
jgi:hypothetical protein